MAQPKILAHRVWYIAGVIWICAGLVTMFGGRPAMSAVDFALGAAFIMIGVRKRQQQRDGE